MDREQPIEPRAQEQMRALADVIKAVTPPGFGFALLMFPYDGNDGRMNYISSARRADMLRALKEFVGRNEAEHGSAQ